MMKKKNRFFTPNLKQTSVLEYMSEYLDLVDLYPSCVPLYSIKRHMKDFTRSDLNVFVPFLFFSPPSFFLGGSIRLTINVSIG